MAKRKNTVEVDACKIDAVKEALAEIERIKRESEERGAKFEAEHEARVDRRDHPTKYLTDADLKAIESRLLDVLFSLKAIRDLAVRIDSAEFDTEATAIKEMARANMRGVDACVARLSGIGAVYSADELEMPETEATG